MHLWQDGLLALLAAIGLASLLWGAVRGLFFSRPRLRGTGTGAMALLPARGDGAHLEEQVRCLGALGRETGCFSRILLADCGLSDEGRQRAAILAADPRVRLCGPEDIPDILDRDSAL